MSLSPRYQLVPTRDKHVMACYCCGKNDHNPEQCVIAERKYGILRGSQFHKKNFEWVRKHNPNGYKCKGCRRTHHLLFKHCPMDHHLNIPNGPSTKSVARHVQRLLQSKKPSENYGEGSRPKNTC
jgi:hypothetical protein